MFLRNTDKCGLWLSEGLGSEGLCIDPRVEDHPFDGWSTFFSGFGSEGLRAGILLKG